MRGLDTRFDTGFISGDSGPLTSNTGFPGEVSFFADVAPILQPKCAPACHEPGGDIIATWTLDGAPNN